jgi:hypothetical protein
MVPSQHSRATNSTPPRQHCEIVKSKFALSTAQSTKKFWVVPCLNLFRSAECSAQKNQTLSKFRLPSKWNSTYCEEVERFWVHISYFLYIHFYEWCGFKAIFNGTEVHPWKFSWKMKFISSMKNRSFRKKIWHEKSIVSCGAFNNFFYFCHSYIHILTSSSLFF